MSSVKHKRFNGKLLITGEYLVLDGATALAVPTRYGQEFKIEYSNEGDDLLYWISKDMYEQVWLEGIFNKDTLTWLNPVSGQEKLEHLLSLAITSNPDAWKTVRLVESYLDYPANWGLGSSSTLVTAIAEIGDLDPFELNRRVFNGSGYDIACAKTGSPILFKLTSQKPDVRPVKFFPDLPECCFFVFLGKKQNSRDSIAYYRDLSNPGDDLLERISTISEALSKGLKHHELIGYLKEHEHLLSDFLRIETVQQKLFKDFPGVIKSLGGWGGDFCLAIFDTNPAVNYFYERGYSTVIPYNRMVL
jgi:mevalonate kinase